MCGITGVVSFGSNPINVNHLKLMSDVIAHRGPDDAGYLVGQTGRYHKKGQSYQHQFTDMQFQHRNPMLPAIDTRYGKEVLSAHHYDIYLGHRRLAVIDPSSQGHQPISNLGQSLFLTYNGEIYNYKALRAELSQQGYDFVSNTDSEVILAAYSEWGEECVHYFNGMFSFVIWDKPNNRLFIARDRYGIKPFYYTVTRSNQFIFASEVKAILAYSDYEMAVDESTLFEYFTFQNIFTDQTLYRDIKLLSPGHSLTLPLNADSHHIQPKPYWDFHFEASSESVSGDEYVQELKHLFQQAVERQLVSDVEVGAYLSGGMDSGSITAVASDYADDFKTFTVGFDLHNVSDLEFGLDERRQSEYLSYLYKTEHYEMVLKSGDMERCLPLFSWHLEEPRVGQSYPNYYAAKLASKFVKVVLSGCGGDELFGGYPWRYFRAVNQTSFNDYIKKYYHYWQRMIPSPLMQSLFSPIADKISTVNTLDIFRQVFRSHKESISTPEEYINQSLYFEAKTFLHGLLVVEDKLSMAHSLETRVPFLDNDLVDFAQKLPVHLKISNLGDAIRIDENRVGSKQALYFQKVNDGKQILRKACASILPSEYTNAPKQGFSSPDKSWFQTDSLSFLKKSILHSDSPIYEFLNREVCQSLIMEHVEGKANRRLLLWSLLNFHYWYKNYM